MKTISLKLSDASLVRMAEESSRSSVLTLDADFTVYRKHGRRVIPLILPAS